MKLLSKGKDGGPESHVWCYWLIEWKRFITIALVDFHDGSRDAYHSHAFNSISWVLRGHLTESILTGGFRGYLPSWRPIITRRDTFHKVVSHGRTFVLTFRGPWAKDWQEYLPPRGTFCTLVPGVNTPPRDISGGTFRTLTSGRIEVPVERR